MRLHKVLQQIDLETLGIFAQRIGGAGYDLGDLDMILNHECFTGKTGSELHYKLLDQIGSFIQRCCHCDKATSLFDLGDLIGFLDARYL
jgi:hypothetical protein